MHKREIDNNRENGHTFLLGVDVRGKGLTVVTGAIGGGNIRLMNGSGHDQRKVERCLGLYTKSEFARQVA
jgi:hypothetical protein